MPRGKEKEGANPRKKEWLSRKPVYLTIKQVELMDQLRELGVITNEDPSVVREAMQDFLTRKMREAEELHGFQQHFASRSSDEDDGPRSD